MLTILSILFGLIIGSFLNTIIDSVKTERPSSRFLHAKRSQCLFCKKKIAWFDNFPILSWIFLRGKCRNCKTPISVRYLIVESVVAAAAGLLAYRFALTPVSIFSLILISWLLVLAAVDWETGYLPDVLTLSGIWLGLLISTGGYLVSAEQAVFGAVSGYICLWLVNAVYTRIALRQGIGQGDFKLLAMLGAWLGLSSIPFILAFGAGLGAIWHILFRRQGRIGSDREVPFGPWLALGGLLALFMTIDSR